jgi:hypothetical protein
MADRGEMTDKASLKRLLGELPFTAELYWQMRQNGKPLNRSFSLRRAAKRLPDWRTAVQSSQQSYAFRHLEIAPKKVLIFVTLHYWIEHAVLMGMALAGLGQEVTLAYLPYPNWRKALNRFDLRRHNAYSQSVLSQAQPYLRTTSWLNAPAAKSLPPPLENAIQEVARRDVQYTLQVEDVDLQSALYRLRLERDLQAGKAALAWIQAQPPDVILTPNGSILEMGAVYQAACHAGIPVVTYEFGEQRGRIWLAQGSEVMRQETDNLWEARKDSALDRAQWEQIRSLFASRQRADLWANFSRRWQGLPSQGGDQARLHLGLDARPLVLLAANVIGDSLTLGRQVFTKSMTEWLQRSVAYFAARPDMQLVVRIHPGERYTKGPSVADVVQQALPELPDHIHLVAAGDPVNTYDLVEIAELGLVYTTTVGMEMAMSGVPVIVAGETHYRAKGFTLDPDSWRAYEAILERSCAAPAAQRMSQAEVERAWNYAYRFFFEYPHPFPWHLLGIWDELQKWPLERVLSSEGQAAFGDTFRYLLGEPIEWGRKPLAEMAVTERL